MSAVAPNLAFSGGYVRRAVDDELDALLALLPAIHLDGPKAVGKTATAIQRCPTQWRLDRAEDREIAQSSPKFILAQAPPVLIDEWQRVPDVWDAVKTAADQGAVPGSFVLTGSAGADTRTHSGAGRIATVRMRPLAVAERGVTSATVSLADLLTGERPDVGGHSSLEFPDYTDLILASGFPGIQHLTGRPLRAQLDGYIERIIDRDLPEAGFRSKRPATLRAWLRAYAAATATTTSWDKIRDAAAAGIDHKPARSTTAPYVDALTRLGIVDDLDAWVPSLNQLTRLTQSPKHHLADPALAARLLRVDRHALLTGLSMPPGIPRDGTFLGALFESLATLCVRVYAQTSEAGVSHLRQRDGTHEVDLIVTGEGDRVLGIEVKLGATVDERDVRHLKWLQAAIRDRLLDSVVLTTGAHAYRRSDGIAVVPLSLLGP